MRLSDLIAGVEAEILTLPPAQDTEIDRVYAGDRISDLLNQGNARTLLVSNLSGNQILRVAELMDVPALCLVGGIAPEPELIRAAASAGTVLLVSPFDMFETCGRLYQRLRAANEMQP
jgi:hypothetical protein